MSSFTLRTLLRSFSDEEVLAVYGRWNRQNGRNGRNGWSGGGAAPGGATAAEPAERSGLIARLARLMEDDARVEQRVQELPDKLLDLLDGFLGEAGNARDLRTVLDAHAASFKSRYEIEASLVALQREGFVFPARAGSGNGPVESWAVPGELAACITALRRRQRYEVAGTLTLKGFLQRCYFDRADRVTDDPERAADHARKVYKIYLMETSVDQRVRKLPAAARAVFDRALGGFGGVMPTAALEQFDPFDRPQERGDPGESGASGASGGSGESGERDGAPIDVDLLRKCFEDGMLGTVAPLPLARFGIEPVEQAVVVFHEITLLRLQQWSSERPPPVEEALQSGVDLCTNVGRFLREISSSKVQFTVDGDLYRASAKRITKGFLAVPGGYMPRDTQIRFIYRFCRSRRLVERSGERALRLSDAGASFEQLSLHEKLRALLAFAVEERAPQGEHLHQVRLRRILLRFLRRVEPEQWHEALFIPFLARNAYLSRLDELRVEELFAARFKGGGYVPTEGLHRISLHLLDFVKRRLYPLGLCELGLRAGRPVAVRLSRLGADLLGAEAATDLGGDRSSVVVNPDFEIILFPGDDEHEVVHTFDRFSVRHKTDHIYHFALTRESVCAALGDGMALAEIVQELNDRCRAPLPQNVLYSLEDWADRAPRAGEGRS